MISNDAFMVPGFGNVATGIPGFLEFTDRSGNMFFAVLVTQYVCCLFGSGKYQKAIDF